MKTFKLLSLILAVLMLSVCVVGCGGSEKVTTNVTVSVIANDEVIFGPASVAMETAPDALPTILDCAKQAFDLEGIEYATNDRFVTSVKEFSDKVEGEYTFWWEFAVNGAVPDSGFPGTITANEGDAIVFTYTSELTSVLIENENAGEED